MYIAKVKRVVNPHKRHKANKRRSSGNPAHLLTLGLVNPYTKGKKKVATKTKIAKKAKHITRRKRHVVAASNPRRRAASNPRRKRRNSTRIVVMAPKHRNGKRRSSRNPRLFGQEVTMLNAAKMVAGGLVGVTATKTIVPMLPSTLISTPIGATVAAIAVAIAGGWAIGKVSMEFGNAFAFGGLMQAGSVLLNAYVPGASQFALQGYRGMGEFVPGAFAVPQNPVLIGATPSVSVGGAAGRPALNRAYPRPY
jgi:hypothetical protein